MKRLLLLAFAFSCFVLSSQAITLVQDGNPTAEIVVAQDASPSVVTAAQELKRHLKAITGAELPIVNTPTVGVQNQVYVGNSSFTQAMGVTLDGVNHDGFKIVSTDHSLAIVGREFYRASVLGQFNNSTRQQTWETITGRKWRFPVFHDFRTWSSELGFFVFDGTGTLSGTYHVLEQIGMRWYMPISEIGIVYPSLTTVVIPNQVKTCNPEFPIREFEPVRATFKDEFLWWKSMRVGSAFIYPQEHSLGSVLKFPEGNPVTSYGVVNGKVDYTSPRMTNEGLRADHTTYLETVLAQMPQLEYSAITPPDGWSTMDDTDTAAGWNKIAQRGTLGAFSDYTWDHIMDVRSRLLVNNPALKFIVYAYAMNKLPPTVPATIPSDVTVVYCQTTSQLTAPSNANDLSIREDWLAKIGNGKMLVYDYYFEHSPNRGFPPVPVIFTASMQQSFSSMYGRTGLGTMVIVPWDYQSPDAILRRPGINHLMIYLHNRFLWDQNLDLSAVLNEYYDLFFGPASAEMKEFYEFAEAVWMRPGPRVVSPNGGLLTAADVDAYFEILGRAKNKAGNTIYGQRIDLILAEMDMLQYLFSVAPRVGTSMEGFKALSAPNINGDLTKTFWTDRGIYTFTAMRDLYTGDTPPHLDTRVSVRWITGTSKLVIGIECIEPKMGNLSETATVRDSLNIYNDDYVEIRLETPQGVRPVVAVNPLGTIRDTCVTSDLAQSPEFYSVESAAVQKLSDRWTVEVMIDVPTLEASTPSTAFPWGLSVNRQRKAGNTPEFYMLSPTGSNFDDSRGFGNLKIREY